MCLAAGSPLIICLTEVIVRFLFVVGSLFSLLPGALLVREGAGDALCLGNHGNAQLDVPLGGKTRAEGGPRGARF